MKKLLLQVRALNLIKKVRKRPNENEIALPISMQYLENLQGSLKGSGVLEFLLDERRKDKDRENKKISLFQKNK